MDGAGNLFGTATAGGTSNLGTLFDGYLKTAAIGADVVEIFGAPQGPHNTMVNPAAEAAFWIAFADVRSKRDAVSPARTMSYGGTLVVPSQRLPDVRGVVYTESRVR